MFFVLPPIKRWPDDDHQTLPQTNVGGEVSQNDGRSKEIWCGDWGGGLSEDVLVWIYLSRKGSRERCLPVFCSENETEENGKNGRKRKMKRTETEKKRKKNKQKKEKKWKIWGDKTGKKRRRRRPGDPFCAKSQVLSILYKAELEPWSSS